MSAKDKAAEAVDVAAYEVKVARSGLEFYESRFGPRSSDPSKGMMARAQSALEKAEANLAEAVRRWEGAAEEPSAADEMAEEAVRNAKAAQAKRRNAAHLDIVRERHPSIVIAVKRGGHLALVRICQRAGALGYQPRADRTAGQRRCARLCEPVRRSWACRPMPAVRLQAAPRVLAVRTSAKRARPPRVPPVAVE